MNEKLHLEKTLLLQQEQEQKDRCQGLISLSDYENIKTELDMQKSQTLNFLTKMSLIENEKDALYS
jgi:hypothetical protein